MTLSSYTENAFFDIYSRYWRSLRSGMEHSGGYELFGKGYQDRMMKNAAGNSVQYMIEKAFWKSYAANRKYDDPDRIEAYMGHFPHGGIAIKLLDQLGQIYKAEQVQPYDYNLLDEDKKEINNYIYYRSKKPKSYDFSEVANSTTPIHIFSASEDSWAHPYDTEYLYRLVSEYANQTAGFYHTTPYGPRNITHLDGSHFTFYLGMNDTWTQDVLATMKSSQELMEEKDKAYGEF